jgi:hypothetical protein
MVTFASDTPAHDATAPRVVDLRPAPPAWLNPLLFVVWIGLGGYWWYAFVGPYRWLAEWQMSTWGAHYPGITLTVPIALGWAASDFAITRVLGTRMMGVDDTPMRTLERLRRLAPVAILAVGAVLAASWNRQITDAGALMAATPADLPAHADKAGLYLALTAVPDERMAVEDDNDVYFAVRQAGDGPDVPALAVVAVREHEMQELIRQNPNATVTLNGLATRDLDATLRRFFEQQGVRLVKDPWVVRTWQTPDSLRTSVRVILGMAIVMALVVAVLQARDARGGGPAAG